MTDEATQLPPGWTQTEWDAWHNVGCPDGDEVVLVDAVVELDGTPLVPGPEG